VSDDQPTAKLRRFASNLGRKRTPPAGQIGLRAADSEWPRLQVEEPSLAPHVEQNAAFARSLLPHRLQRAVTIGDGA
jgi:hypothetical protein